MKIIIDIDGNELRTKQTVHKEEPKTEESELQLKLMNQENLEESEQAKLEGDIVLHIRKLLKAKKKKEVVSFLKSIKHAMSEELRGLISEELKLL